MSRFYDALPALPAAQKKAAGFRPADELLIQR